MAAIYLINGESPKHWGVTLGTLTRINQGVDVLTLPLDLDADGTSPWSYDEVVTLTRDGVPCFRGRVMSLVSRGEAVAPGVTIQVGGPWWELSRLPYVKLTLEAEKTYRFRYSVVDGARLTSLEMLKIVLDYAVAKGLGFQLQEEEYELTTFKPPRVTKQDRRCDELIRSALTAHPETAVWFDYSTTPPTFRLTTRGDEGTILSYTKGVRPLKDVQLQPRPDLVPSGVVVRYEGSGSQVSLDGTRPARLVDKWPAEAEPDVLDAMTMTFTLKSGEVPFAGYAKRLYEAFSTMPWEGSVTLSAEDCVEGLHPGQCINITSGQASWGTMKAMVQGVQESLNSGLTQITLGLPQYCGYRPTIWTITRRQHEDQSVDTVDSGESAELAPAFEEMIPETALTVYVGAVTPGTDETPGSCQIRVTPGLVTASYGADTGDAEDESEDEVYPTLDGTDLAAVPPPYISLAPGGSVTVWLELHVTPTMQQFDFTDSMGEVVTEYRPTLPLIIGTCRIVSPSAPTGRRWEVDYMTGEVTDDARLFLRLGSATWASGAEAPVVSPQNEANVGLVYMPPQGLIRIPV